MNRIMAEDIKNVLETHNFDGFDHKSVFITGATGLIGSMIAKCLLEANRSLDKHIKVIAFIRNEQKARDIFEDYPDDQIEFCVGDICSPILYEGRVDYVIHSASATSSKFFVEHPVETIDTAINGTMNVLNFAKEKDIQGFVYLSSLEIYGKLDTTESIREEDCGYIDFLNVRSSYSEGKRMVECICASYAKQYHMPVKIARLTQTFGAGVNYHDGRVFAEFIRCVIEEKDIVLHTTGETVRNYCYLSDAVRALLLILEKGNAGEAYNVANKDTTCSIVEMARVVAELNKNKTTQVCFDIEEDVSKRGYNPTMIAYLNTEKIETLGWKPTVGLTEMFQRTMESMVEDCQKEMP